MGHIPEGGYQFTTAKHQNFRYKARVTEDVLQKIIALLDLPPEAKQMIGEDGIRAITIIGPEPTAQNKP